MSDTHPPAAPAHPVTILSDLTTDIVDITKGYDTMLERAEPDLLPIVERFHALHTVHATELKETLDAMGGHPEDAGSMMGTVHSAVATARDWFGALDTSALDQIIKGEDQVIDSYTQALRNIGPSVELRLLMEEQRATLKAHLDPLRAE